MNRHFSSCSLHSLGKLRIFGKILNLKVNKTQGLHLVWLFVIWRQDTTTTTATNTRTTHNSHNHNNSDTSYRFMFDHWSLILHCFPACGIRESMAHPCSFSKPKSWNRGQFVSSASWPTKSCEVHMQCITWWLKIVAPWKGPQIWE